MSTSSSGSSTNGRRRPSRAARRAPRVRPGELGQLVVPLDVVGERAVAEVGERRASASVSGSGSGWIRLTTTPPNGNRFVERLEQVLGLADRLGARAAHDDERRRVGVQQSDTSLARRRRPRSMFGERAEELDRVLDDLGPASRAPPTGTSPAAALVTWRTPAGRRSACGRPDGEEPDSRSGASSRSIACATAGCRRSPGPTRRWCRAGAAARSPCTPERRPASPRSPGRPGCSGPPRPASLRPARGPAGRTSSRRRASAPRAPVARPAS